MEEKKMKLCKHCRTEIDAKAKVCPQCGKKQGAPGCLIVLLVVVIIAVLAVVFGPSKEEQQDLDAPKITLEEYNQIEPGMTYDQVVKIIGSEGTPSSEVEVVGVNSKLYTWEGVGDLGANANVTFVDGKVTIKAQFGLE